MKKRTFSLLVVLCLLFSSCFAANASVRKIIVNPNAPTQPSGNPPAVGGTPISSARPFRVYLSPSSQFNNMYVNGGTEEQYMRLVAEAMVPYLNAYGIQYVMAKEKKAIPQSSWDTLLQMRAEEAAVNGCDLYLALHSNASPSSRYGANQGTYIYYQSKFPMSRYWAQIVSQNYIYPDKSKIKLATNDSLIDMRAPTMPSILIETAYHDNVSDANWIKSNINPIAASVAYSIAQYRHDFYGVQIPSVGTLS